MDKKVLRVLTVLAIAVVLCASAYAIYSYQREMPWEHRAYITPRSVTLTSVLMESGYNDTSGYYDYGDVGNIRTWDTEMKFTAILTNPASLTATFSQFDISITLNGVEKIVSLSTTSQEWIVPTSTTGDVFFELDWTTLDVENGSGTAEVIFNVEPNVI